MKMEQQKKTNTISFKKLKKYSKGNSFVKDCLKYLEEHYNLFEGAQVSYQQFKSIIIDLIRKIQDKSEDTKLTEDKYHQHDLLGLIGKLRNLIIKIFDRIISAVTSIGFQPIFFAIGLYTTQSVVVALIASSIYWVLCLIIRSSAASTLNTNKWYEPSNFLKVTSVSSIIDFFISMKTTVATTAKDIFNWFFLELEDEKSIMKFRRRMLILVLIVFLLLYITF